MDEVVLAKIGIIERCLARIEEEYRGHENTLATNYTRQDSIVLNLQRACEAAIDLAMHKVRVHKLGVPQQSREAFLLLQQASLLPADIAEAMQKMVGFRNIAIHNYRQLDIMILQSILDRRLDNFSRFCQCLLQDAPDE